MKPMAFGGGMGKTLLIVACVILCAWTRVDAQSDPANRAREIFALTNHDRVAQGLPPLRWNAALAAAAQGHAERMADENFLSHEYPGEGDVGARAERAGAHFQAIAENIATGPNGEAIEDEWMHSAPHRRNILDPQMNAIGIGVVERRGTLYAVEDFDDASEALSAGQVESRVGALLRREGIEPMASHEAAEEACATGSGYPKYGTGRLVIRFDTPDLRQLPEQVAGEIRGGDYRKASVAVCSNANKQGSFTTYRVAIVLY
jgi:hypothetical protein